MYPRKSDGTANKHWSYGIYGMLTSCRTLLGVSSIVLPQPTAWNEQRLKPGTIHDSQLKAHYFHNKADKIKKENRRQMGIKLIAEIERCRGITGVWINYGNIIQRDLISQLKPVTEEER